MKLAELLESSLIGSTTKAVGNFNKSAPSIVDDLVLRGGRPLNDKGVSELKDMGVDTVICLLKKGKRYADPIYDVDSEKEAVEKAGLKFIHFDMIESEDPDDATIRKFLHAARNNGKVYLHCSAGQDRAGLLSAIYEVEILGKSYEEAYANYIQHKHDWLSFPNLDRFFYKYCSRKFKTELHPEKVIDKLISPKFAKWLLNEILK